MPNVVGCEVEGVGGDLFDDEHCLCCPGWVGVGGDLCDCFVAGFGSGSHFGLSFVVMVCVWWLFAQVGGSDTLTYTTTVLPH